MRCFCGLLYYVVYRCEGSQSLPASRTIGVGGGGGYGIRYEELEVLVKPDSSPGWRLWSSHVDALEPPCVLPGR